MNSDIKKILIITLAFISGFLICARVYTYDKTTNKQSNNIVTDDTTTTVKTPDGTTKIVRVVRTVDHTKIVEVKSKPSAVKQYNVSALAVVDSSKGLLVPLYGISVSKQIIGPLTAGVHGYTNGMVGVSLGFNF